MEIINGRDVTADKEMTVAGTVDLGAEVDKNAGIDKIHAVDVTQNELLIEILTELKKIEYHLSIATDVSLNDQDVF